MRTPDEYRKIAETYYRLAREAKAEAERLALHKIGSRPPRAKIQSLPVKGAGAGTRGPRVLGECSTD
jgi:hypothetical protein